MKALLLMLMLIISNIGFSQTIQLQFNRQSEQEARFNAVYTGSATEISLPERGRLISLIEQDNVIAANGKIIIGNTDSSEEFTVNFSYSMLLGSGGRVGLAAQNWYPTIKSGEVSYELSTIDPKGSMIMYPFLKDNGTTYTFNKEQNPNLVLGTFTTESIESPVPITIHTVNPFELSIDEIGQIYSHFQDYFGALDIDKMVIINSSAITPRSEIKDRILYITMFGNGTKDQLSSYIANAWEKQKPYISSHHFAMFKDSILRLDPITFNKSNESSSEETSESSSENADIDAGTLVLIPKNSYYEELFHKGFDTNQVVDVNVNGIFENFALLHMAHYNIGNDKLLAGIKAFYQQNNSNENSETEISQQEITNSNEESYVSDSTNLEAKTIVVSSKDPADIDWSVITQNELTEPLYSLYSKEVLGAKNLIPQLSATGNLLTRNSLFIPNLTLNNEEEEIDVNWNNFRSVRIPIEQGTFTLDESRQVPQQSYMNNFYSFDPAIQQLRARVLSAAEKAMGFGQQNFREHLQMFEFTSTGDSFDVPSNSRIFVVISHIFSNKTGILASAIKESYFLVDDEDNSISHIATRTRI